MSDHLHENTQFTASYDEGISTDYDGMQREKTITQSYVNGSTSHTYLKGNKRRTNNNRGYDTTTTFHTFGAPSYDTATKIEAPHSVTTDITINLFGDVQSISQGV
jgi:hypothetical protein